jgi:uncharacterized protein
MSNKEVRSFELRADGGQAQDAELTLRGYAATYDSLSKPIASQNGRSFHETINRGAFKKALAKNPNVVCLLNHDNNVVLGRTTAGTLALSADDNGLRFSCQLDKNNSQHRDLHASVKRGDISECSFGFGLEDGDDDFDVDSKTNRVIRTIRNISHLYDVSVVTNPAYNDTGVQARANTERLASAITLAKKFDEQVNKDLAKLVELQGLRIKQGW